MLGSAMFTIVASSTTISCAVQITMSASTRLLGRCACSSISVILSGVDMELLRVGWGSGWV